MTTYYLADHDTDDYPGGAEKVDYNIYTALKIPFWRLGTKGNPHINKSDTYILGNAVLLTQETKNVLMSYGNYCIFEHDYKIHPSRQPHRYPGGVFPKEELINLSFYKNAKAVFLQTQNHLEGFRSNNVPGNLINLSTSIWSEDELMTLSSSRRDTKGTHHFAIIGNQTSDKGSDIAIKFCKDNSLDYTVLPTLPLKEFYKELSKYPALIYFPRVRESFCRLVVEARCLLLNVITNKNYGAVCEPWFSKNGPDMITFLRERTKQNLATIQSYL